ncbi:hypothetical protein P7K49_012072, partial [Saguinus oedipus]
SPRSRPPAPAQRSPAQAGALNRRTRQTLPAGEARAVTPGPTGLTCLKQKGMVRTLTPTMLFTMFVISPQLEAAAAVIVR